jgi:hypothetical protein
MSIVFPDADAAPLELPLAAEEEPLLEHPAAASATTAALAASAGAHLFGFKLRSSRYAFLYLQ